MSSGRMAGTNALGDRHEELVPCCVTEAVVHGLEVVEIDEEDGDEVRATDAALERVRYALREERAVRETRQRVVEGLVGQLILERSSLGDVARRDDDAADVGHSDEVVEHALELDERAVLAAERQVARHRSARDSADLREETSEPIGVVALEEVGQSGSDELVLLVAEDTLNGRRVISNRQIRGEEQDDVARVLDE